MPVNYPLINGHRYSFSSITIDMNGIRQLGFKSINYKASLKPGELRGTSPLPLGRTRGDATFEGDLEMYRAEFDVLLGALGQYGSAIGGFSAGVTLPGVGSFGITTGANLGFMEVAFPIIVSYQELSNNMLTTDTLEGVRITDVDMSNSQGTDGSTVKLSLHVMNIQFSNAYYAVAT